MPLRLRLISGAIVAAIALIGSGHGNGSEPVAAAGQEPPESTIENQTDLAVTIYNSQLALVRDVRQVSVPAGTFALRFADIAATINQATVHFRSLTEPAALRVLEQNYEYDLLEPQKLLQKYVGREITLVRQVPGPTGPRTEEVTATLIANNNGPVWRIGSEIVIGMDTDYMRFPELPENLYSHPTLVWTLENSGQRQHRVETSYLANRIGWNADYVLTVARDDTRADLDGWVTITNGTGTMFRNARLQLVAGNLNRIRDDLARDAMGRQELEVAAAPPAAFAQENFSEYHLYTLARRTSIHDNETKQLSLLNGTGVPVDKAFVVEGKDFYYHNTYHPGTPLKDDVKVMFKLKNDTASNLGMPMPAGNVRVYQSDSKGGVQFIGEDRIDHTPKDESITLHVGNAFDIVCERKQTDFRKLATDLYEMAFEITLRNHKETPVTVEVNEPIAADWEMLSSSHKWTKTAAWAARFEMPVAAGGTSVLTYRFRTKR
jgi:hypothetical protein